MDKGLFDRTDEGTPQVRAISQPEGFPTDYIIAPVVQVYFTMIHQQSAHTQVR